ncbi:restriction endonuclease subunit S [uncultured Faecalibacterium sp.]|mgnify:CR=1 FL=1|uniref:restriction endonuclease subunit S n=2 Tax=Faecalibacterium TaxID=216851 RepID=UPI00082190B2|nr:restriction endonuclease subunit S [uncultured Faecalibacterium sp.]SCI13978.1 Type I restriction modification DNA specificity domain [uncultured Faecalibacterium sp.]
MQDNEKKPALRFKGFTDPWEQRKLGEMVDVCSGMDYKHLSEGDIPVYGTGGYMLSVNKALSYDRNAVGIGRKGTIDKPYILKAPFWTVDTLFYAIPKDSKNIDFTFDVFQKVDWKKKDESTGVPSLSKIAINETSISTPSKLEQERIGSFFRNLDTLITLHQRKYEKLVNIKKSMLDKMFPQNGASVPEIRFKGFTDPWEQRKLEEYLEVSGQKNFEGIYTKEDVLSVSGDFGIVNQIEFQGRSFAGASVANYGVVETGDIVYTKSPLKSNPYGIIKANKGKNGIVSTLYAVYKPKQSANPEFVQIYFEQDARMNNYMHPLVNKGAKNDMKVSAENALKGQIVFPDIKEQRTISEFFRNLDTLITLHQRKLEKLQNIKKSCLEKMFV